MAAEGARPLICFSTEEGGEAGERLILTFGATRPETLDFATTALKTLTGPLATLEHELVFAPGIASHSHGELDAVEAALLRLKSGDLGLGFASTGGALTAVSLSAARCRPGVRPLDAVAAARRGRAAGRRVPADLGGCQLGGLASGRRGGVVGEVRLEPAHGWQRVGDEG